MHVAHSNLITGFQLRLQAQSSGPIIKRRGPNTIVQAAAFEHTLAFAAFKALYQVSYTLYFHHHQSESAHRTFTFSALLQESAAIDNRLLE